MLGPQGIGKTRLLAELAVLASHDGAEITYASLREPRTRDPRSRLRSRAPTLVLLDDAETWPEARDSFGTLSTRVAGTNALLVIAMDDSSLAPDLRAEVAATDGDRSAAGTARPPRHP